MLLVALIAAAMTPSALQGEPLPAPPPRHPEVQARLARGVEWGAVARALGGWSARFDEATGRPVTAWGPPVALEVGDGAEPAAAVVEVLARAGLVDPARLTLRRATHHRASDTWYLDWDLRVGGVPLRGTGLSARVRGGRLFLVFLDPAAGGPLPRLGTPAVDPGVAQVLAELRGPAASAPHLDRAVRPALVRVGAELRRVWEVSSTTTSPPGRWVSLVDAADGTSLAAWNEVRFLDGTVTGVHDVRTVDGETTESPLPLVEFTGALGGLAWADSAGAFVLDDTDTWTTTLSGSWLRVRNGDGDEGVLAVTDGAPRWTTEQATQDEIDNYVFLHRARDFGLRVDPENPVAEAELTSTVNVTGGDCNAWYDGNLNFLAEGDTCVSYGRIADVAWHEWGHAFHTEAVGGGATDTTVGEGTGDIIATFSSHDSVVGPGAYKDGSAIRDVEPDLVYPRDVSGQVHHDGLIWAGALWDAWGELLLTYGETRAEEGEAWSVITGILARALRGNPSLGTAWDEVLAADDDNGDPSDGTPHQCELWRAFSAHGLSPLGTQAGYHIEHAWLGNQPADAPIAVRATLVDEVAACRGTEVVEAAVDWSADGGATWASVALEADAGELGGELPAQPDGAVIWYALRARTAAGEAIVQPASGTRGAHSFYVGELTLLGCTDFEADDGGYVATVLSGSAHDWEWGTPAGDGGDPAAAWSGSGAWGTDLGADRSDGLTRANTWSRLESAPIPLSGATAAVVQFRRWLTVEDPATDQARVDVDGTVRWSNTGTQAGDGTTEDGDWVLHTVRVDEVGEALTLGWELQTDSGPTMGGWNLDDVCVYAPAGALPDDTASTTPTDDTGPPADDTGTAGDDTSTPKDPEPCGCGASGSGPASAWALVALGALAARRRRRTG